MILIAIACQEEAAHLRGLTTVVSWLRSCGGGYDGLEDHNSRTRRRKAESIDSRTTTPESDSSFERTRGSEGVEPLEAGTDKWRARNAS